MLSISFFFLEEETEVTLGTTELISIAVVSALLVWLLVGLSLVCYRFLIRNSDECIPCEPDPAYVLVNFLKIIKKSNIKCIYNILNILKTFSNIQYIINMLITCQLNCLLYVF